MSMAESLGTFNTMFAGVLVLPSTGVALTPICHTRAITTTLELEKNWLTIMQHTVFIDPLKADQCAADVYLALTEADVHQEWVRIQLDNLGVTVVPL